MAARTGTWPPGIFPVVSSPSIVASGDPNDVIRVSATRRFAIERDRGELDDRSDAVTPGGQTALDWRGMREVLWPERRTMGIALACALVGPVAALAMPFAAKLVIDEVIRGGRTELLLPVAVGTGLAVLVQATAGFGAAQAGAVAGHRAVARLRQRLQRHVLRLPVAYFDAAPTGTVVSRVLADTDHVRQIFGAGVVQLVSGGLTAVLAFVMLSYLNWQLTIVVAAILGLVALALGRAFARLHPAFHGASEGLAGLAGRLTERLTGIRVVKAHAAERHEAHGFAKSTHEVLRTSLRAATGVSALIGAIALATGGVSLVLLVFGGQAVAAGAMTLGDLALFVFLVGLLGTPVIQAAALGGEVGRALAAFGRIREVLALAPEEPRSRRKLPVPEVVGEVRFEDVSYAYTPGRLVLRDVNLHAPPGSMTALVGVNGAGKSTMLRLLMAFDEPTSGRILIDGRPLAGLSRRELRRNYGVVLQSDALLFSGTVEQNIRYGRSAATLSEVLWSARLAHCDEFVSRLPGGYRTQVGEAGVRLSGGERQRVAIARAFLADPRILILDEATSQLDGEGEALVEEALARLRRGRTTFVIAHRLATVRSADQILVLEGGIAVERGTHEELVLRNGHYSRLYEAQCRSSGIRKALWMERNTVTVEQLGRPHAGNGDGRDRAIHGRTSRVPL